MKNKHNNFIIILCSIILLAIFAIILYNTERPILFSFFIFIGEEICFYKVMKNLCIDILSEKDFKTATNGFLFIVVFFAVLSLIFTVLVLFKPT